MIDASSAVRVPENAALDGDLLNAPGNAERSGVIQTTSTRSRETMRYLGETEMNDAIDTTALEAGIRKDAYTESDLILEREATALSAIAVVMAQRRKDHPTLLSAWTTREIARLLHALADDPGAEVRLGDQYLGKGVAKRLPVEDAAPFRIELSSSFPAAPDKNNGDILTHVEDYSKQGSEG